MEPRNRSKYIHKVNYGSGCAELHFLIERRAKNGTEAVNKWDRPAVNLTDTVFIQSPSKYLLKELFLPFQTYCVGSFQINPTDERQVSKTNSLITQKKKCKKLWLNIAGYKSNLLSYIPSSDKCVALPSFLIMGKKKNHINAFPHISTEFMVQIQSRMSFILSPASSIWDRVSDYASKCRKAAGSLHETKLKYKSCIRRPPLIAASKNLSGVIWKK